MGKVFIYKRDVDLVIDTPREFSTYRIFEFQGGQRHGGTSQHRAGLYAVEPA